MHATLLSAPRVSTCEQQARENEREKLLSEDVVKPRQRDCRNSVVERVCFANGSYDICRSRVNRVKRAVGAFPDGWRSRSLAFERHSRLSLFDDEINLSAASCAVERNVRIGIQASDVGQHHLLPAAAERRMRIDFIERPETQKRTRQTGVAEIDLGRLNKPLVYVCAQPLTFLADSTATVEFSHMIVSHPLCAVNMGGRRKCVVFELNKARHTSFLRRFSAPKGAW